MNSFLIAISLQQNKEYYGWENYFIVTTVIVEADATVLLFLSSSILLSLSGSKFDKPSKTIKQK
jgi:hypothetical protein